MSTQLAVSEKKPVISEGSALSIVQYAIAQGAGIDVIERLMALKEREEANEARRAYDAAMAEFKAHPPRISKNKHVEFGQTKYDHATLDHVTDVLTAALSHVGISHRFEIQQNGETVTVSCILRHNLGHSERTSLTGPIDKSGSKNPIQSVGSAVTYLQRYTLLAAVGMAAGGDDDGASSGQAAQGLAEPAYLEYLDNLNNAADLKELQRVFTIAYKAAEAARDKAAMQNFVRAKDARKADLNDGR